MKVKEANSGLLTNFEVLDLLRSRGANKDDDVVLNTISPSEGQVFNYIRESPAGTQTRESLQEFHKLLATYNLTKAESLQVINLRPSSAVEVHLIVEDCEERINEEAVESFLETVEKLPEPPEKPDMIEEAEGEEGDENDEDEAVEEDDHDVEEMAE